MLENDCLLADSVEKNRFHDVEFANVLVKYCKHLMQCNRHFFESSPFEAGNILWSLQGDFTISANTPNEIYQRGIIYLVFPY